MNWRNRWFYTPGAWGGYSRHGRQFCGGPWVAMPMTEPQPSSTQPDANSSLTYIGPCRCGWGPHAYYRDQEGRIIHASRVGRVNLSQSSRMESQVQKDKQQ